MAEKGLGVYVYRSAPFMLGRRPNDATNGGVSGKYDRLTLVGEIPEGTMKYGRPFPDKVVNGPFEPDEDSPAVRLAKTPLGCLKAVPVVDPETVKGLIGPMFGGNYISTSDSRFPCDYPIPVHDRWETPETYRALSI